jgi:hypothetical protein
VPEPSTDLHATLDQPALAQAALAALPAAARAVLAAEDVGPAQLVEHAVEALLVDARLARLGATVEHLPDDPVERLLGALPARARERARALACASPDAPIAPHDPFPRSFPARAVKRRGAVDTEAALVDLVLDLARWDGRGALLEPAVGRGAFLVRAWARALDAGVAPDVAAHGLVGVDVHPFACRAARVRLALLAAARGLGLAPRPTVHLGDALDDDARWPAGRFDLVVGNPPYVRGERLPAAARARLRARWPDLGAGNVDLAAYFVRRALDWLRPGSDASRLAFVLTQGVCDARAAEGLRARLGACALEALVGFEWAPPQFGDATVIPCVLVARRAPAPRDHAVAVSSARAAPGAPGALALSTSRVAQADLLALGRGRWPVEVVDDDLPLLRALDQAPRPLVAGYGLAIRTHARASALIAEAGSTEAARFACPRPLLDGREVRAYSIDWGGRLIDYRPDVISDPKSEAFFAAPKVVMARIALSTQAAVDDEPTGPFFARNTVMVVRAPGTALDDEPHALCAVINSLPLRAYAFLVLRAGALAGSHRATFYSGVIGDLPVPAPLVHDRARARDLAALARRARDLARADDPAARRAVLDAIDDAVALAYGLAPAVRAHLRARAAAMPLARVLRAPRAGAPLRRIALREWAAGARYL